MQLTIPDSIPRVALVTGGAKRIGRALVMALAAEGFKIAIHRHQSTAEAEELLGEIHHQGCILTADLADEAAVSGLVNAASAQLGPVGILVNNASIFERDAWDTVTDESWQRHQDINLRAPFVLSQSFARALPSSAEGVILNLLDERVWKLTPHYTSYTVSKSALWTLTQTLALALAPRIRVNAIGPGPVLPAQGQSDAEFLRMCHATPLQHGATPEEVAQTAMALAAMRAVTGQMVATDGGQHLAWQTC
ncbi:Gluconate 5-dehydrogenase [Acetobacteraceae bacterium EV16G]|uniref:SDR family oxidoreductase n=1 Tax=Sorlinia euscelidii TaxID=3081148 RepID=UPI002F3D6A01